MKKGCGCLIAIALILCAASFGAWVVIGWIFVIAIVIAILGAMFG
jgi:hypothetical protein